MKQTVPSFAGYLSGFEVLQKARGPFEHTPAATPSVVPPVKDSRHIDALGSQVNPSHEQRQAAQKKLRRRGGNSNVGYFTAKERHALSNYTKQPLETSNSGHYLAVNDVLSGNARDTKKDTLQAHHAGRLINQAISHAKLHKNMKLHRSGNVPLDVKEGSVISTPRLTSTTSSKHIANRFKDKYDPESASIVVKAKKGDPAFHYNNHGLSKHMIESEVLFGSHQKFHVHQVKVHKKTGHRTITLATYPKRALKQPSAEAAAPATPEGGLTKSESQRDVCPHFARRISGDNQFTVHADLTAKSLSTFGSYQDAFQKLHDLSAAANNASASDQHYAWSQYQRLFDLNRQNIQRLEDETRTRQAMQFQGRR